MKKNVLSKSEKKTPKLNPLKNKLMKAKSSLSNMGKAKKENSAAPEQNTTVIPEKTNSAAPEQVTSVKTKKAKAKKTRSFKKGGAGKKAATPRSLPKPVQQVWDKSKPVGRQIVRLIKIIPTLIPRKSPKDAPLLDGNVKILPQFRIQTKLIGCYIIPVIMIVILGVVSYSRSSTALNENYEAAVSQTMNMAKEYFSFVFTNIESDMNVYLSDEDLNDYYSGTYSTNEAQQNSVSALKKKYDDATAKVNSLTEGTPAYYKAYTEMADVKTEYEEAKKVVDDADTSAKDVYDSLTKSVSNKVVTNPFIGNIYIFKDGYNTITSNMSLRATDDEQTKELTEEEEAKKKEEEAQKANIYSAFLDTELGKLVASNTMDYHWYGSLPKLDTILSANSSDYLLRVAHDVSSTSDAAMIVDIKKDSIMDILTDLNLGVGSYVGLITSDKQELVIEGKALTTETTQDESISEKESHIVDETIYSEQDFYHDALASEKDCDSVYVRYNGDNYLFTYQKINKTGIMLCSLVPKSIIVAEASSIRTLTFVMVLISCLIAMIVGTLISRGFSKSINHSIKELEKVSKGDLTVEFRTNRRDEFALLYGSCNDMLANIRGLILEVESVYETLAVSLNKVNTSSTTFSQTTKDIQTSVHEVEIGVGEQSDSAASCLTEMDSLFNKINTVNDNTNEISEIADSTKVAIATGLTSMDNLNEKTKSTTNITDNVIQTIKQLSVHSSSIGQIVNSINDIAEETNLLSLNASIEAARAGAAGRGFAVVATQIRKLADQCLVSAGKISNLVTQITAATNDAVSTAETAEAIVEDQVEAVAATAHSFQTLKQRIDKLSENLAVIQNSSKDMEVSGSTTLNSIENISAVLEETLASITSVVNVTDTQTAALSSLDEASSQLMVRADRLGDAISKFTTHKTSEEEETTENEASEDETTENHPE